MKIGIVLLIYFKEIVLNKVDVLKTLCVTELSSNVI